MWRERHRKAYSLAMQNICRDIALRYPVEVANVYPFHALVLGFHTVPVGPNVLCVCSCGWIYKCYGVVDSAVLLYIRLLLHLVVGCPFVTMNDSSRMQVLLYDREQRGRISMWYHLHITECRAMGYIHHSKNPNICSWRMSSMNLIVPGEYVFKPVLLHTLTLWRKKDSSICTTCPEPPHSKGASRFMSRQLHTSQRYW